MAYLVQPNDTSLRGKSVRLIADGNDQMAIVSIDEARSRAESVGKDLVLVAPQASPPVCRIMDYGKFQYEQSKKQRIAKKKQHKQKLKEVKFHPNIDAHDYKTKLDHAVAFLEKGYKVKASIFFRGREMAHTDLGMDLMQRFSKDIESVGQAERPRRSGRMIVMMVGPNSQEK